MRTLVLLLILIHGLIHGLGFVKGFGLAEIKALSTPISKPMALLWLLTLFLFLGFVFLYWKSMPQAWMVGLAALVLSQVLVFWFWKDAKFGSIPNLLVAFLCLVQWGQLRFHRMVEQDQNALIQATHASELDPIEYIDVGELPQAVQCWLNTSGAMQKPMPKRIRIQQKASMQMKPGQKQWMDARAIQISSLNPPGFVWSVRASLFPGVSVLGRDRFTQGKGEMLIQLNGLFSVVNARGPKLDQGSLQRYLGEIVWYPKMALSPYIRWYEVDENKAEAELSFGGTTGKGTFHFGADGAVEKFEAMRYQGNAEDAQLLLWEIKVLEHKEFEGVRIPSKMESTWHNPEGPWTWLKLEVVDLRYQE